MSDLSNLLPLPPGLVAVTGDEGVGKTRLLRGLAGDIALPAGLIAPAGCMWLDLALPGQDELSALQVWDGLRQRCPAWNAELHRQLLDALGLQAHQAKQLYVLSTGSRRKVALVGLLACGATVTCLDQPYAALDGASISVMREFLADMADHASRTWVVADYVADPRLPWRLQVELG